MEGINMKNRSLVSIIIAGLLIVIMAPAAFGYTYCGVYSYFAQYYDAYSSYYQVAAVDNSNYTGYRNASQDYAYDNYYYQWYAWYYANNGSNCETYAYYAQDHAYAQYVYAYYNYYYGNYSDYYQALYDYYNDDDRGLALVYD